MQLTAFGIGVMVRRRKKVNGYDLEVSNDFPLPEKAERGRPATYPWKTMPVGGSFVSISGDPSTVKSNVASANRRYAPKHFIYRTLEGEIRVWRDA